MEDTRANGITAFVIPPDILDSIRTFYTVIFGLITWFVKTVVALGLLCMILQLFITEIPSYVCWIVFLTNAPLIFMAALYIIPMMDRLMMNTDSLEVQSQYARTVLNAHLLAASCVALMIILQLIILTRWRR